MYVYTLRTYIHETHTCMCVLLVFVVSVLVPHQYGYNNGRSEEVSCTFMATLCLLSFESAVAGYALLCRCLKHAARHFILCVLRMDLGLITECSQPQN
jgi:hypothetical protein